MNQQPRLKAPAKSCDAHMHIIYPEDQLPFKSGSEGVFPTFPATDYMTMATAHGIERSVVVVTPAYGTDNRCVFQAMDDLAIETRGIIALTLDAPDATLRDAKAFGITGLSTFMFANKGVNSWDELPELAARAAEFGMHLDIQLDGHELPERFDLLNSLPCDLVIDHIGKFINPPTPVDDPAVACLFSLMDNASTYVKLSAAGETSNDTPPYMADAGLIAAELVKRYPERLFWASNWPHLGDRDPADKPDTAVLLNSLAAWAPDEQTRHKILVDNPGRFYFGDAT